METKLGLAVTLVNVSIALCTFIIARRKDDEEDTTSTVEQNIKINMKLDELCRNTNDIKLDARMTSEKIESIIKTQVEHDTKINALEKQITELKGEMHNV